MFGLGRTVSRPSGRTLYNPGTFLAFPRAPCFCPTSLHPLPASQHRASYSLTCTATADVSRTLFRGLLARAHPTGLPLHAPSRLSLEMVMRRAHSNNAGKGKSANGAADEKHEHGHEHTENGHSHSLFSMHTHSHSHGGEGAATIVEALQKRGDPGSRITLIGLFSNVGLTAVKGAAGWYMHSAALLAEAGHSLSDLVGDFVTLFCWRLSRRPPSERYPYGFAKFETLGTTTVSLLLVGGALGIGVHSYHLLLDALSSAATTLPPGPMQVLVANATEAASAVPIPDIGHAHDHGAGALDPNAAWFALVSVVVKEWLYRATRKVADGENSPVLLANAIHHRSDAYSSFVVLLAILGSWWFPALPLDPLGGLIVSILILRQSWGVMSGSFSDLTDASVPPSTRQALTKTLEPLLSSSTTPPTSSPPPSVSPPSSPPFIPPAELLAVSALRARRTGSLLAVDLTADVPARTSVGAAAALEERIARALKEARGEVAEVRVRFRAVEE